MVETGSIDGLYITSNVRRVPRPPSFHVLHPYVSLRRGAVGEYPSLMAVNWLEVAKKMAEDARAQLAINRKRLREIVAERARQQAARDPHANAR